ncbi:MAG: hypothetical protein RMK52_03365 [Chitinophagales bacterium]|nr:non-structural protein 1 [Chitinophagales bacterium]MDW8393265.1 hypothetical protein [Chitinophagales bacterium]
MIKCFWLFFLLLISLQIASAQPYSAFVNLRDEFILLDDSVFRRLDFLPPRNQQIGGNAVAFTDNRGDLRIVQSGKLHKPFDAVVTEYGVSASLIYMRTPGGLYVWDQDRPVLLTRFPGTYVLTDSLFAWLDAATRNFHIYFRGRVRQVVEAVSVNPAVKVMASGPNIVAFKPYEGVLNAFWNDQIYDLQPANPERILAGTDLLAYTDLHEPGLHVFYRGDEYTLEQFNPKTFQVGNGTVAYVNREGAFRVFQNGDLYDLGNYEPELLAVRDHVVLFSDELQQTQVLYHGELYKLENAPIENFQISQNSVLFTDRSGRLQQFLAGRLIPLPPANYLVTRLDYDVVQAEMQGKRFRFLVKGRLLDY